MKSSKGKGLIGLLILLIAVGLFGFLGYDTMDDIKLGLDLAGGVSITYQAVEEEPGQEYPMPMRFWRSWVSPVL